MKSTILLFYLLLTLIFIFIIVAIARRRKESKQVHQPTHPPEVMKTDDEIEIIEETPTPSEEPSKPPEKATEEVKPTTHKRTIRISGIELTPKTLIQAIIINEVLKRRFK